MQSTVAALIMTWRGSDTEQPVPQPNQSQLTNSPEY